MDTRSVVSVRREAGHWVGRGKRSLGFERLLVQSIFWFFHNTPSDGVDPFAGGELNPSLESFRFCFAPEKLSVEFLDLWDLLLFIAFTLGLMGQ